MSQASTVYATLVLLSLLNALYLFRRKRNYRLFELPIEEVPPTPSANLVPVDSSPSSSPLRLLSSFIPSISQRVKPSESSVWEVSTWDPFPLCLTILTYFSPLHLLLYQLQLPGSLTILLSTTIFSAALSLLLNHLITSFQLLSSDTALLQAQLFKEYNIKYVLPRLNPEVRNAAVQCQPSSIPGHSDPVSRVFLSTPTTNIRRAFRPNPNPLYDSDTDLSHLVNDEGELNASAGSGGWSGRSSLGGENRRSSGGPGTFLTPSFLSRPGNAFGRKPDPSPHKPDLHRSIFSSPLAGPTMLQNQRLPTIPGTPQANTSNSSGHCPPGGPDSSPLRGPTARVIHVTSGGVQTLDGAPFAFTKTNGARRDAAIATSASALEQAERFPRIRHASPVKHTTRQAASAAVTNGAGMTTGISNGVNVSVNSNGNGNSNGSAEGGYLGVYSHAHSPLKKGFRQNGALAAAEESPVRGAARAGNHAQARRERGY